MKFFGSAVFPLPCATFQIKSASSAPTSATASSWPVSLSATRHQAGTMNTGVPTVTWSNSHSADGMNMRMQPCEAE